MEPRHRNKKALQQLYWEQELNQQEIGELLGVTEDTISIWMKKLGVPCRAGPDYVHLGVAKHFNWTPEAVSFFNGSLLGDGALDKGSTKSARYKHSSKYRGYLEWVQSTLHGFGIETGRITAHKHIMPSGNVVFSYYLNSKSYPEFLQLYQKWYSPELGKQPPNDLVLDSITLRQWYIDDGTFIRVKGPRGGRYAIVIANFSFTQEKTQFLLKQLYALGLSARLVQSGFSIGRKSVPRFFNIVGPCPVTCYQYKWPEVDLGKQLDLL